ncbi:MAG: CHAT domain-containing protein [Acidobacteriota bacterium]|nr:CHAT domain-containing protein [Acidobacteriota bacterium]
MKRRLRHMSSLAAAMIAALFAGVQWHANAAGISALADAAAELPKRPIHARLAGFPYVPLRHARGRASARVDIKIDAIASEILHTNATRATRERALAQLLRNDRENAVMTLEELIRTSPADAILWTDLAAARYELGTSTNDTLMLAQALAAADESLRIDPRRPEAHFNRALALEKLGLTQHASRAADDLRLVEPQSPWLNDLRTSRTPAAPRAEQWKAAAPRLYVAAMRGDEVAVRQIVTRFSLEARKIGESVEMDRWSRAILARQDAEAEKALQIVSTIGRSLRDSNGDSLLAEAVETIETARRVGAKTSIERLARAQATYTRGRLLVRDRNVGEAASALSDAASLFRQAGSPMELVAEYYRAGTLVDLHRQNDARKLLARLEEDVPPRYRSLRAQVAWEQSRNAGRAGQFYEALALSLRAADAFAALGETNHATQTRSNAVALLSDLGRADDAWQQRPRLFSEASEASDPVVLESVIHAAATDAVLQGEDRVARSLYDLELSAPAVSPIYRFDALLWRSLVDARTAAQQTPDAAAFASLRAAADKIEDAALRSDAVDKTRFVEALARLDSDPGAALGLLDATVTYRAAVGSPTLSEALAARARLHVRVGATSKAIGDYERAMAVVRTEGANVTDDALRDAFFGTNSDVCHEFVDLLVSDTQTARAFQTAETCRTNDSRPQRMDQPAPREGTAILAYTTTKSRTLLFAISPSRTETRVLPVGRDQLTGLLGTLEAEWQSDRTGEKELEKLSRLLLAPVSGVIATASTIVIVPDDVTANVPFSALRAGDGSRYLVDQHRVAIARTAAEAVSVAAASATASPAHVVALADPAFDSGRFPWLERLPHAREEAEAIEQAYAGAVVLTGELATVDRFMNAVRSAEVVHLGSHALPNARDSWRSALVLARSGTSAEGVVYLREIASLNLRQHPLVVLAACRAASSASGANSLRSFASAFLAAGSRGVVAPVFDVDDERTTTLMRLFYASLRRGAFAADALREAQLAMIQSKTRVSTWASFEYFGGSQERRNQ